MVLSMMLSSLLLLVVVVMAAVALVEEEEVVLKKKVVVLVLVLALVVVAVDEWATEVGWVVVGEGAAKVGTSPMPHLPPPYRWSWHSPPTRPESAREPLSSSPSDPLPQRQSGGGGGKEGRGRTWEGGKGK